MYKEIREMNSADQFLDVATKLATTSQQRRLFKEIREQGLVFFVGDLIDNALLEQMATKISEGNFPDMGAEAIYGEGATENTDGADMVHRLQLLAYCNAGLRGPLERYLTKMCL